MDPNKVKAVDMIRRIRNKQYDETKNMTPEEKKAYFHQRTKVLLAQLEASIQEHRQRSMMV